MHLQNGSKSTKPTHMSIVDVDMEQEECTETIHKGKTQMCVVVDEYKQDLTIKSASTVVKPDTSCVTASYLLQRKQKRNVLKKLKKQKQ